MLAGRCPWSGWWDGRGVRREVLLALNPDDCNNNYENKNETKNSAVTLLIVASSSVRQPPGVREAFNDTIKTSHPATAIT